MMIFLSLIFIDMAILNLRIIPALFCTLWSAGYNPKVTNGQSHEISELKWKRRLRWCKINVAAIKRSAQGKIRPRPPVANLIGSSIFPFLFPMPLFFLFFFGKEKKGQGKRERKKEPMEDLHQAHHWSSDFSFFPTATPRGNRKKIIRCDQWWASHV